MLAYSPRANQLLRTGAPHGSWRRSDRQCVWSQKQLTTRPEKAAIVIQEEPGKFLKTSVLDFENAMGRPMTTLEEAIDALF